MKKKHILLITLLFIFIVNILNTSLNGDEKELKQSQPLFRNYNMRSCRTLSDQNESDDSADLKSKLARRNLGLPVANRLTRDKFEIKMGRGEIGYLFDYIDPIFKQHIFEHFSKLWKQAGLIPKIKFDDSIKDEYDLKNILKMVNYNSDSSTDTEINLNQAEILDRIKKIINKNFNLEVFSSSINMKQLNSLLRLWKYPESIIAKNMIDKFDMDGDGRLNVREFILFTIIMLKEADKSSDASYDTIINKLIDPLFKYIDCEENEYIKTEEFFEGVKYIIRPNKLYDLYYCKADDKALHSVSFNEFFLKNNKFKTGKLLIHEFRRGILLGYWDRMTTTLEIKDSDELSEKILRWSEDGKVDKSCKEIEDIMKLIN